MEYRLRMAQQRQNEYNGYVDEPSLTQTPTNSTMPYQFMGDSQQSIHQGQGRMKGIPEIILDIDNRPSQDTLQTMETGSRSFNSDEVETIHEDSETDDRLLDLGFDSPSHDNKPSAFTRYCAVKYICFI